MLTTAQLEQLKRTNISKDPEKTKERVTALWQGLKIKQKQAIRELAGTTAQPIYRTQETGNISARMTLAFAQSLGVSPAYIIGEADEPGECTEAAVRELLQKHGYKALLAELQPMERQKRAYTRHPKPEPEEALAQAAEEDAEEGPAAPETQLPSSSDTLTAEDLQNLIFALYVQAKAGITSSKEKLDQIKLIILS